MISQWQKLAYETWRIAQGLTPYKSGNMRHNAIFLKDFRTTSDGATWRIHYSGKNANYIEPQNEGWTTPKGNVIAGKKFVEGAMLQIGRYLQGTLSEDRKKKFIHRAISTNNQTLNENERYARKLELHKSIALDENGNVKPLKDPKEWRKFYGL